MPEIVRLTPVESIKPGTPPQIAPDGTILNPVKYRAADVEFDDGLVVQVERPLTLAKLSTAWLAAKAADSATVDGISAGAVVPESP